MRLTVKLYAGLSQFLPPGSHQNATTLEISAAASANQVIDQFRIPRETAHLVLLNGIYVKPEERDAANFHDGDTLAIWPPVAGG